MKIKKIALMPNIGKNEVIEKCTEAINWLKDKGIQIIIPAMDAINDFSQYSADPVQLSEANLAVTLGGDGTVLRAIRLLGGSKVPVLAVNYGRIGFLAEIQPNELYSSLQKVFKDDYSIEKRPLLHGFVKAKENNEALALNDFIVCSPKSYHLLHLDVFIDGQFLYRYAVDGLAIAGPTGSTAYSLSAGGPLVSPVTSIKVLTPVNPHTLFNRSIIISRKEDILIKPAKADEEILVTADGITIHKGMLESITVSSSEKTANLVRFGEPDFFTVLRKKLTQMHPLK